MAAYTLEHHKSPNSSTRAHYGYPATPTGITLHHWGSTGQTHDGVVNYLSRANGNTSAHDVVSGGRVTELVDDERAAWHAGSTEGNGSTIGIECRPEMSAEDWATLVQLCTDKEEKWGSLKYFKHSDWKATACPGKYSDRIGELVDAVNAEHKRRKSGGAPAKPSKPSKPKPDTDDEAPEFPLPNGHYFGPKSGPDRSHSGYYNHREDLRAWQSQMLDVRGWTELGEADGLYGDKTAKVAGQFQAEKNLDADKLIGADTWAAAWTEPVT